MQSAAQKASQARRGLEASQAKSAQQCSWTLQLMLHGRVSSRQVAWGNELDLTASIAAVRQLHDMHAEPCSRENWHALMHMDA